MVCRLVVERLGVERPKRPSPTKACLQVLDVVEFLGESILYPPPRQCPLQEGTKKLPYCTLPLRSPIVSLGAGTLPSLAYML